MKPIRRTRSERTRPERRSSKRSGGPSRARGPAPTRRATGTKRKAQAPRPSSEGAALRLVERRENSLLSLFELSRELGVGLDVYAIAQLSLLSLLGHFGTRIGALWMRVDEQALGVVPVRHFGIDENSARSLGAVLETCATAQLERDRGPVRLAAWARTPRVDEAIASGLSVVAPVAAQGRLLGLIALGDRLDGEPYGTLDLEYLATAAGMVGAAIDNAQLYHRMVEANRQLLDTNLQLSELDRLKSEFLQGVNHELRTPLAVIVGYLDMLDQIQGLDENARRAVTASIEQAQKLSAMVGDLLEFSEAGERIPPPQLERCDLVRFLGGFTRARRPGIANGLREFVLEIPAQLPQVLCDPRRLLQVLDELVDNAVKFTAPGSRIVVRAVPPSQAGEPLVIEVEDDGPGIAPERMGSIFEAFRQGDASTTREAGGLGLGLALARRVCQAMGGGLDVLSEEGSGSTFRVWLTVVER